ncbi:FAD-dependent oxidoreductase [Deinococcus sp.]|uniref:FAD-dependent oxidoreductase n=1 Tax=Deinococcus sp. TaxID=47478 RepID=UPI003B592938
MSKQSTTDVLICGAGAAGLTLAIDLARRGVAFRLIDKLAGPFAGSRGKGIQPRTQEVFEDLGLIDRLAAVGSVYPPQREYHDGAQHQDSDESDILFAPPTAQEPYRTPLMVPQFQTEAVLRLRLFELGHVPEYGYELQTFEQDAGGVTAHLISPNEAETVRCRYLVGGDGGRSLVRHVLQINFPGETLGVRAIVADLRLDGLSRDVRHRFNGGDMARQMVFSPLPHTDLFQLQAPVALEGEADLSVSGLQRLIDARQPGSGILVRGVTWASAYLMNARLAERYRVGRVLLMGDAAHIHPPTGGQGLNTSVQDAYNLGWKLGAVLAGAPETLLDSYEEERRPIAAQMLGIVTGLLEKAKHGDMRRGRELHQLGLGYPGSSLSLEMPERRGGVLAGDRAPDALLLGAGGQPRRLFDVLKGTHWTLIVRGQIEASLPATNPGLRIVQVGEGGEFIDTNDVFGSVYGLAEGELLLIRPDGYVGAVLPVAESRRLTAYLANVLPESPTLSSNQNGRAASAWLAPSEVQVAVPGGD